MKASFNRIVKFVFVYIVVLPLIPFITPLRVLFDYLTITHPDLFRSTNTPENHNKKVRRVQEQVLDWNRDGRKTRMCTARPGWQTLSTRKLDKRKLTQIKLDLEDIIEIDTEKKVLRVEPGIKTGTLTYKLLKQGWTIPVIPELETLTVGGLINGAGIETSSHKYGLFSDSCLEFEVVLSDGTIVNCSREKNSEIFHSIPVSHGTIGFLTGVTIPLLPAKKYVKVEYVPAKSLKEAGKIMQNFQYDFLEAIAYDLNKVVVIYGKMVDDAESSKINNINRWYKPFYHTHVNTFSRNSKPTIEYISTRDYYHRHQRGYFWEVEATASVCTWPIYQYLFGWIFPVNIQLMKLIAPEWVTDVIVGRDHVLQDFTVPFESFEEFVKLSHKEVEVYPIWLCPVKLFNNPGMQHPSTGEDKMYIDVGIYGISNKDVDIVKAIRKLEKFARDVHGFQYFYTDTFMTREEFNEMFDMELYNRLRKKLGSEDAFPYVYDKISLSARNVNLKYKMK